MGEEEHREEAVTSQERHVTELTGPEDRWLSVTDASRVARRQEHTIRSWVKDGTLPVHPDRVGLNKRTRQVRLSDLATLTPTIDLSAAVGTDMGTVALPNIPKMQLALQQQMEELSPRVTALVEQLASLENLQHQDTEQLRREIAVQGQDLQGLLQALEKRLQDASQTLTEAYASADEGILAQCKLEVQEARSASQSGLDSLNNTMQELHAASLAGINELIDTLGQLRAQIGEAISLWEQHLQQAVLQLRQEHQAGIEELGQREEQARSQLQASLNGLGQQLTQLTKQVGTLDTTLTERIGQVVTQTEAALSTALGAQKRIDGLQEIIQALQKKLDDAEDLRARQAKQFEEALATERREREALARLVQSLLSQKKTPP